MKIKMLLPGCSKNGHLLLTIINKRLLQQITNLFNVVLVLFANTVQFLLNCCSCKFCWITQNSSVPVGVDIRLQKMNYIMICQSTIPGVGIATTFLQGKSNQLILANYCNLPSVQHFTLAAGRPCVFSSLL